MCLFDQIDNISAPMKNPLGDFSVVALQRVRRNVARIPSMWNSLRIRRRRDVDPHTQPSQRNLTLSRGGLRHGDFLPSGLLQRLAIQPERVRDRMDPADHDQLVIPECEPHHDERRGQTEDGVHQQLAYLGDAHFSPFEASAMTAFASSSAETAPFTYEP